MRKLRCREIPTASEKWSQAWNLATWLQSRGFSSPRLHSCPSLLPTPDTWGWPILVPLPLSQIGKMASAWGPLTCAAAAFQMASPGPPACSLHPTYFLHCDQCDFLPTITFRVISLSTPPLPTPPCHNTHKFPPQHHSFPLFFERNDLTHMNSKDICVQF